MMEKREFMERLILERGVSPESATETWNGLQQEMLKDWELGLIGDSGSFLSRLFAGFDALSPKQRALVFQFLRERFSEWTGERERGRY